MSLQKLEILAILSMIGVLLVLPAASFAYQSYREAQEGSGLTARPPSVAVASGNLAGGKEVFSSSCAGCHGPVGQGSSAGPDIRHMSVGAQFVYTWILDPAGVTPIARMPRLPLTERQVADVTAYVMSLKDPNAPVENIASSPEPPEAPPAVTKGSASSADAGTGKTIFNSKGCAGCHGPEGKGGPAGPAITGLSADAIQTQLRTPKAKMPAFGPAQVSDSDMGHLIAFLSALK